MPNTHVYYLNGDGHVRGAGGGVQPQLIDPSKGVALSVFGASGTPPENAIATGAASTATARITSLFDGGGGNLSLVLESINFLAFRPGETINFDTGQTATLLPLQSLQSAPLTSQFLAETKDALLLGVSPASLGDSPWWDRRAKVASEIVLASGFSGTFTAGQRVTTSGGGSFTVWLSAAGSGGTLILKVLRKSGTIAATQTVTGPTGAGTISTYGGDIAAGNWLQHSHFPNLGGLGTFFETIPQGSGGATLGPEKHIIEGATALHAAATDPNDRGVRVLSFGTFDGDYPSGSIFPYSAGVWVQVVECSGTFPSSGTFTVGETVTGPGGWSAKVHSFNIVAKLLHVTNTNGATLTAGTVTGGSSGATATAVACHGWQKGSTHWNNWKANKDNAATKPGALYAGQAAKAEGAFLMHWETEIGALGSLVQAAIPSYETVLGEWLRYLADLRTELGNPTMPVTLFYGDQRQHYGDLPGASYLLRSWLLGVSVAAEKVTLTTADGLEGSQATGLPYPSSFLNWRPLDYVEIGRRAWRSIMFGRESVPAGNLRPLPLILFAGQSHVVGGIPFALAGFDRDPDLYSSAAFPGVSTVDPNVWVWHCGGHVWQNYDAALNGNTFYGAPSGTFGAEASLLLRQKFRFGIAGEAGEVGLIKLGVNATCAAASSLGAVATWDPNGSARVSHTAVAAVTAIAAVPSLSPNRGRWTAAVAGTYSSYTIGQTVQIAGSALGVLGSGGNNTLTPHGTTTVYALAPDGTWIEFVGAFVAEASRTWTIVRGNPPLVDLVETEIRMALEKCVTQLRRVPKPVLKVWWQVESDLQNIAEFKAATLRVVRWLEGLFGQKHKGETTTATVIGLLTSRTPWPVSDTVVSQARTLQAEVAAELGNATTFDPSRLPMESAGIWPRGTDRFKNGVHHTPRGYLQAGYLIDAAAGTLAGIPAFPSELAGVDYFVDELGAAGAGGATSDSGTDSVAPVADAEGVGVDAPAAAVDGITAQGAADTLAAIEAEFTAGALGVQSYTVNGRTVQGRPLSELIELHRYVSAAQQRSRGIRRTRVSF